MKALLLGNGLNCNAENYFEFSNEAISERFFDIFIESIPLFEYWEDRLNINNKEHLKSLIAYDSNWGIEQVADKIFSYITSYFPPDKFSENSRLKYVRYLSAIGLNAIFFTKTKKHIPIIPTKYVSAIKKYDNIFTLNYVELWDEEGQCTYLHGKFDCDSVIENDKEILCIDGYYYNIHKSDNDNVIALIDNFMETHNVVTIDTDNIVLTPESIKKTRANSIYPSKNLYPSKDLRPSGSRNLYLPLKGITDLEIFGISPYGDKDLIIEIAKIDNVTIFIFDQDSVNGKREIEHWENLLEHKKTIFKDTQEFIK